jgi:hypothetical protein
VCGLQDSRSLAIMLLLRHLRAEPEVMNRMSNATMHIVGEITDDETALLAALPDPDRYDPAQPPDFVNANAVTARMIAQVWFWLHFHLPTSLCLSGRSIPLKAEP